MSKNKVILLVVLGCILLVFGNVSLWAARDVFNPERFGQRVAEGLQSDAASEVMADATIARIMEYYPELPRLVRGPAKDVVTWLLQRPAFTPVFRKTVSVAWLIMTTSAQDVIGLDLSNVGDYVVVVVTSLNAEAGAVTQVAMEAVYESGPLIIYESGHFPKLRGLSNTVPWIWPFAILASIGLLVVAYLKAKEQKSSLMTIGTGILITSILVLMLIPALRAPVQNSISNYTTQVVVREVLTTLMQGLVIQSIVLGLIGVILMVASQYFRKKDKKA